MFDVGKWFDEWKENNPMDIELLDGMRVSFGEQCLKEWLKSHSNPDVWVYCDYRCPNNHPKKMAVSCLGEKRCLVLLKKMWEAKK